MSKMQPSHHAQVVGDTNYREYDHAGKPDEHDDSPSGKWWCDSRGLNDCNWISLLNHGLINR